jgi:hypothetical protein
MANTSVCDWAGASGKVYRYFVRELPVNFDKNQNGNYIYAKILDNKWRPIYIGQGDLGERIGPNHHQALCISSKGATHVHVHLNPNEQDRLSEENDLVGRYTVAYKPTGCNERPGG